MVRKANRLAANWKSANISKARKAILINSSIMALPSFYLSVYPVPDSTLDKLSHLARKFLWDNGGNGSGMLMVSWNSTTLDKPEGGLGLRNLRLVKHSLVARNVLNYLNNKEFIWINIIRNKYGMHNIWDFSPPPKCSWFFCRIMEIIKPNLWINVVNPFQISILQDPWLFEIPLNYKPTFINMDIEWDNVFFSDFYNDSGWNCSMLNLAFGKNLDSPAIGMGKIDPNGLHHWVWFPSAKSNKIPNAIYHFLNSSCPPNEPWVGWDNMLVGITFGILMLLQELKPLFGCFVMGKLKRRPFFML